MSNITEEIKFRKIDIIVLLISLNLYSIYLSISIFIRIPLFKQMFCDILGDEPPPVVNQFVLDTYKYYILVPIILIILSFLLLKSKKNVSLYFIIIGIISILFTSILKSLMIEELVAPFFKVFSMMGSG